MVRYGGVRWRVVCGGVWFRVVVCGGGVGGIQWHGVLCFNVDLT